MKRYLRATGVAVISFSLLLPMPLSRAQDFGRGRTDVVPIQCHARGGPCSGLYGWQRDRCVRARWHDHHRHREGRKDDKDVGAAIAAGVFGLAVGAIIAGAAKDAEDKRQRENRGRRDGRVR